MARTKRSAGGACDKRMATALDNLAAYEEFQKEILPALQKAIKQGKSAKEIYAMSQAMAAARAVTIAATETDSGKALAAIKEILDRSDGKAKERTEVEHKYSKLKDEELDSLILSEIGSMDDELVN